MMHLKKMWRIDLYAKFQSNIRVLKNLLIVSTLVWSSFFISESAQAYPEFIGYGYKSCLTCHWNGHGNGPLNDYGRGVWASEIASRSLYSKKAKLEDISASSGFLGATEIPYWIRPHMKFRFLQLGREIKSPRQKFVYFPMQFDVGAAFSIDQDNRWMFIYTSGFVVNNETRQSKSMNRFLAREYYFRAQLFDPFWIYLGKMDKVFGIRNIDHTAANRQPLLLNQYSQSVGATAHLVKDNWEAAAEAFTGDPQSESPLTDYKGFSGTFEFDPLENGRVGLSGMNAKNDNNETLGLLAAHYRQGLAKGNAVMFEVGTIAKKDLVNRTSTNGSYTLAQTMIKLSRGFHLLTNIERSNSDVTTTTPENWRLGFGALYFPINRFEFRFSFYHGRSVSSTSTAEDNWTAQGQLHVSL